MNSSTGSLPGCSQGLFAAPHMVEGSLWDLFYENTNRIHEGSTFMTLELLKALVS